MFMQRYEPLHADRHRSSFNLSLILALAVAVVGFLTTEPLLILIGMAFGAYFWLTTPSQYMIFNDRLVIAYGKPRLRHIFFQQVDGLELLKLPIGSRLMIRLNTGRRFFIQPRAEDEFLDKFQQALDTYLSAHPRDDPEEERPQEEQAGGDRPSEEGPEEEWPRRDA